MSGCIRVYTENLHPKVYRGWTRHATITRPLVSGVGRLIIERAHIHTCSVLIDLRNIHLKKVNNAEHEYMNMSPSNHRSPFAIYCR